MKSIEYAYTDNVTLQHAIDYPEEYEGMKDSLDSLEKQEIKGRIEMYYEDLSWVSYYNIASNDEVDADNIEFVHSFREYNPNIVGTTRLFAYYQPIEITPIISTEIVGNQNSLLTKQYTYCGSLPMPEELPIEAKNNTTAYHYIGFNFLEVWVESKFFIK